MGRRAAISLEWLTYKNGTQAARDSQFSGAL
jgi:hypothetical protein